MEGMKGMASCFEFVLNPPCLPKFEPQIHEDILLELQRAVSDDLTRIETEKNEAYQKDKSRFHHKLPPKVVVSPITAKETSEICKICYKHKIPMIGVGRQTGLEGGMVPQGQTVVMINLMKMKDCTHDTESMTATVGAGVLKSEFEKYLAPHGLFYAPDPSSDSSLGGQAATSGSGTTSVMYGTTRENILSLTVVLPDGRIIERTRPPVRKTSTGYHLHELFMGAEGTLGLITKLVVRIRKKPGFVCGGSIAYEKTRQAVECVTRCMAYGLPLARLELVNKYGCIYTNEKFNTELAPYPHLFFEFHTNNEEEGRKQYLELRKICHPRYLSNPNNDWESTSDYPDVKFSTDLNEMDLIWKARRGAYLTCLNSRKVRWPKDRKMEPVYVFATDSCLPLPKLAEVIEECEIDFEKTVKPHLMGIDIIIIAHIADGNFHCVVPMLDEEEEVVEGFHDRLCARVIAAEGTVSGEHGIGLGKRKYLRAEHGDTAIDVMWQIKDTLDPLNLLNAGKVLPDKK